MKKYNILIVEDHTLTRFAIKTILEETDFIETVFEAQNAKEAYTVVANKKIDLILMDLGLPNINGVDATKEIKAKYPEVKIVVLTSHTNEEDVIQSLKAGASSYCCKDIEPEMLKGVVKSTLDGASWFDAKVSDIVLNSKKEEFNQPKLTKEDMNLTSREYQILKMMAEGMNNIQISKNLNVSVNTVKSHVGSVLQKLNVDDRVQAVIIAIKQKLV